MGHNVWSHINAVQEANRQYDLGQVPKMLVEERFDQKYFRDVVDEIFAINDRDKALALIEEHSRFWMTIPGTRGAVGKKTVNASTYFDSLFEVDSPETDEVEDDDFDEEAEHNLEVLEDEQLQQ